MTLITHSLCSLSSRTALATRWSAGGFFSWSQIYNKSVCYQTAASMHKWKLADVLNALHTVPDSAAVNWELCPRAFGLYCSCASQPATESSTSDRSSRAASNCCHVKGNITSDPLSSLQAHSQILTSFSSTVLKD